MRIWGVCISGGCRGFNRVKCGWDAAGKRSECRQVLTEICFVSQSTGESSTHSHARQLRFFAYTLDVALDRPSASSKRITEL
mmetsp:Transcript_15172/g.40712  ORF Transcript_15172/g.40712 Transcript_15172/m.40712 type:complete len:82 (+) Transcript_15172:78-323(+)